MGEAQADTSITSKQELASLLKVPEELITDEALRIFETLITAVERQLARNLAELMVGDRVALPLWPEHTPPPAA